ncbi:MAG: 2-isopropylmalate synthase [Paludibacteraceae bacterium]|nr:2-isopropylmalate synthase [Paludibacteraceae bacterium]
MIQILDTTLRDGEQTSGVAFAPQEKLSIASLLLEDVGVDRIEVASARVSQGEYDSTRRMMRWAQEKGYADRVEVLGFVDGGQSVEWIRDAGGQVLNLLCKGSMKHCVEQLGKRPEEHFSDIKRVMDIAHENGLSVNVYLEDWSNGMLHSPEYVHLMLDELKGYPVKHFMLPDTLGILNPVQTGRLCREMVSAYPELNFDFHAHNDYDLAVANVFAAVEAGITSIHTTVNGLGERAGNAPLSSVVAVLHDQLHVQTSIKEEQISRVSKIVETYSGVRVPGNKPVVGEYVFTQVAGVHADGDLKNNLYCNDLLPERFGRTREWALGKSSGNASIKKNLEALGIHLEPDALKKVTSRIVALGDKKQRVTQEDLPYIISDVLKTSGKQQHVRLLNYSLTLTQGLKPVANISVEVDGQNYQQTAAGDGQYDAFMHALWAVYDRLHKPHPLLADYVVAIPPGGRTDAFVQTIITWNMDGRVFKTHGLDADQMEAAIQATEKMLNIIES